MWEQLLAAYQAARAAELAYDKETWTPAFEAQEEGGPRLPDAVSEQAERLSEAREAAESALMACPSPDASAFAFKYLVAFGDGREADQYHQMLEVDARRFTGC